MKKVMLAALAAAAFTAAPASADPGICDSFLEPQMQQHQYFDDDTQAVIDSLSPCKPG